MNHISGRRVIVFALGISPPGSMGGNSKIALELIRGLSQVQSVVVITTTDKLATFEANIGHSDRIDIHAVALFPGGRLWHPIREALHYTRLARPILEAVHADERDVVYCCSDFLLDVLPPFLLKPAFRFKWAPSLFLFVPFVFENWIRRYKFPALKYCVYYAYQRAIFQLIKSRGDLFVITNDCDRQHFPRRLRARVLAIYGGVNVEQIAMARPVAAAEPRPTRDVVFCGRLHPQKGIRAFLDVWRQVVLALPGVRLTVIGNGADHYERDLRKKAERLGISDTIEWLGYVNNEEKYRVYVSAKVFVHPTVYDNNGMVAAEALCSGLPVVMYDLPSLRSVYTVGCTKVPERNRAAFAAAICRILSDREALAAARPSADDVAELQRRWSWPTRVQLFREFLEAQLGASDRGKVEPT